MKNILLIRTSTTKQEVESQKKELLEYVHSKNKFETVVVGNAGASAIKLDEQYIANINKVYDLMERGDIVWAWSVDRIGRNEEVLMSFKNRLIKEGVNLIIKNPSLELLQPDGKVNNGIELAFSLYATMAKQEMEVKMDRFKRAKRRNKESGKFNGGKVMFGYAVQENGCFRKDDCDSKVVYEIFYRYANEPVSCRYLAKDYHALLKQKNLRYTEIRINRILKNENYKGNGTYPQIVPNSLYEQVQQKMKEWRINPKVKYAEHPYWCQGLLFEVCDDGETHRMRVKKAEVAYMSYLEHFSVSINYFDSLVFRLLGVLFDSYDQSAVLVEIRSQNKEIEVKRRHLEQLIEETSKKEAELDEKYYVAGTVSNYQQLKRAIELKINSYKTELESLHEISEDIEKPTLDNLDEWQIRDIFLKYIQRIYIRKLDRWECKVDIVTSIGNAPPVIYSRHGYVFRYTDSTQWIKIEKLRNIEGRKRT